MQWHGSTASVGHIEWVIPRVIPSNRHGHASHPLTTPIARLSSATASLLSFVSLPSHPRCPGLPARSDDCGSAVVVYDWDRAMLEVIFEVPPRDAEAPGQIAKRVGGPVEGERRCIGR